MYVNLSKKIVVRKAKDGINHEAVIMRYCGDWYESHTATGYTETEAIRSLIDTLKTEIAMLKDDLDCVYFSKIEKGG